MADFNVMARFLLSRLNKQSRANPKAICAIRQPLTNLRTSSNYSSISLDPPREIYCVTVLDLVWVCLWCRLRKCEATTSDSVTEKACTVQLLLLRPTQKLYCTYLTQGRPAVTRSKMPITLVPVVFLSLDQFRVDA